MQRVADVEFSGQHFELRRKLPQYALLKFAQAAKNVEVNSLDAMGAILDLIEKCITVEDWPRFNALADEEQPGIEDLFPLVARAFEEASDRPTSRPVDSSAGPTPTLLKSASEPVEPVTEQFGGRPDMEMAFQRQLKAVASA